MELQAREDFEEEGEEEAAASVLPPREAPALGAESTLDARPEQGDGEELAFREEAPRIASDPPVVLDVEALAFHEESQRVASDPPQYLDVEALALHGESQRVASDPPQVLDVEALALHEESQRINTDPPQVLDVAALEASTRADGAEGFEEEAAPPLVSALELRVDQEEAPPLATPGVGPLPGIKITLKPRESAPAPAPTETVGEEGVAIGSPLRPRNLLAPIGVGLRRPTHEREIDAELIPQEVHNEFATRRAVSDLSVAERQARQLEARRGAALTIGGVFALGGFLLTPGFGIAGILLFLSSVALGGGIGWQLASKQPNRLVGAVATWGGAFGMAMLHVFVSVGLHGSGVLLGLLFPLVFFFTISALSGMFLSMHLESRAFDQEI